MVLVLGVVADRHGPRFELPAAMTVAAGWNIGYGFRLMRRAARQRRADPQHVEPGAPRRHGICLGSGLFGLGFTVAGVACAVVAGLDLTTGLARHLAWVVAAGIAGAAAPFVPALLLLPGAATDPVARLRRALDALSIGICLLFTAWVLVIAPEGTIDSIGFWVAVLTCCVFSLIVVSVLRAGPLRRAALACGCAVAATIIGLNGLAGAVAGDLGNGWPWLFAAFMIAGPVLAWRGSMLGLELTETTLAGPDGRLTFAGYPVLAIPAAAAIGVAVHRVVTGGAFDRPSVLLGVVGITVVAIRESFGAFDVARYARRVVEQEAQFRNLVAGSNDVIMVLDGELVVRWQSPAAARQFGLSDQDVVGRHFLSMIQPADASAAAERLSCSLLARAASTRPVVVEVDPVVAKVRANVPAAVERPYLIEARLRDGFGRWRETESSVSDQRHVPEVGGLVLHIRDVGERKEMERTVHRLAYADELTGLANRRQLLRTIGSLRSVALVNGAMLLVELDGFTAVNDVRGYDIGDAVLVEVARRLRTGSGGADLAARLSGDEFAIVTESSPVRAYALATRLVTMLAEPVVLPGATVHLTASVGMTDLAGGENSEDVLRRADLALRRAKQLGRGRVEWYDAAVEEQLLRRMTLEQELPGALDRGELDLIYQPILDLVAGRPLAVEALLRWRHPRLGTLLPADVIPVAEDLGLIEKIGSWVLCQATRQLSTWLREGRDLSVAVNVSPRQFDGGLTHEVAGALSSGRVPPERLVLELAEWGLTDDTDPLARSLGELRSRGVRTALDDFGTAAESLTHLRQLPMDMVKIGRSFFDGPARSGPAQPVLPGLSPMAAHPTAVATRTAPIIDVMVGLGRRLGIEVVAQGLEEPEHLSVVRDAGCRMGQGHLFARPQPAEHIEAYLDRFPFR